MEQTFSGALGAARASGRAPIISEIKARSPKEGDLLRGRDPAALASTMESAGAACISVVTEPEHFGGGLDLLRAVTSAVRVPVLRKDFVRSEKDIYETVRAGASCLLLIAALLDEPLLAELRACARCEGLETLVEVHNEDELRRVPALEPDLIGINNRDILRLELDDGTISNTLELIRLAPPGTRVISESAISTADEVRSVLEAGAFGVLVGTSILKAEDTAQAVRTLVAALG
jgi:indole-3-glycerol phosphate synthase